MNCSVLSGSVGVLSGGAVFKVFYRANSAVAAKSAGNASLTPSEAGAEYSEFSIPLRQRSAL